MYTNVAEWLAEARLKLARLDSNVREMERLQAENALLLADAIEAYEWPAELPVPTESDTFGAAVIGGIHYGEELLPGLAVTLGCSVESAIKQTYEVSTLIQRLPPDRAKLPGGQHGHPPAGKARVAPTQLGVTADSY